MDDEEEGEDMLAQTRRVIYHKDGTFSFITDAKKIRTQLDKAGIIYVGGLNELKRFVEEIKSNKIKVKVRRKQLRH